MQKQSLPKLHILLHDLAGPMTALSMTLPDLHKALLASHLEKKSTEPYQLCQEALVELREKMKNLWLFVEREEGRGDSSP